MHDIVSVKNINSVLNILFIVVLDSVQGHTNYVKRCRVVVYELLREYSSTRAAIRDGAVNLNECTTRRR